MKKLILFVLVAVATTLYTFDASAQRTAKGEMGVYASYTHPFMTGWGVSAGWNCYTLFGTWDVSVAATGRDFVFEKSMPVPADHFTARGGYLVRLCATRDRRINLYAGGGILLGVGTFKLLDSIDGIAEDYDVTLQKTDFGTNPYFLFGLYPKVECEYFFMDNVGVDVSCQMPVTIHDKDHSSVQKLTRVFCPEVSAGIKLNF